MPFEIRATWEKEVAWWDGTMWKIAVPSGVSIESGLYISIELVYLMADIQKRLDSLMLTE